MKVTVVCGYSGCCTELGCEVRGRRLCIFGLCALLYTSSPSDPSYDRYNLDYIMP
jgi:hypothetical protein